MVLPKQAGLRIGDRTAHDLYLVGGDRTRRSCTCLRASSSQRPEATSSSSQDAARSYDMPRRAVLATSLTVAAGLALQPAVVKADTTAGPLLLPSPPSTKLGFEDRVEEFTLPNGLHFIVLRRDNAPVVSAHIHADVGAYQEVEGQTGLAHLLEHMAFKGTRRVGTKNWQQEAPLLDAMDEVFYELRDLKQQQPTSSISAQRITQLSEQLQQLQARAGEFVVPNQYGAILSRSGAVGLNATTSHDATKYFMSLPANKLELWFAMESERFRAPVFRELYSEKRVIEEERRLRVDDAPLGRYQQEFAQRALFNNYRRPVIGWEQDFDGLGRNEVVEFFAQHYGPRSLTIALVGDVTTEQVRKLAEQYFGSWEVAMPASRSPNRQVAMQNSGLDMDSLVLPALQLGATWPTTARYLRVPGLAYSSQPGWQQPDNPMDNRWHAQAGIGLVKGGACSNDVTATGSPCYSDRSVGGPLVMLGFQRPPMTDPDGPIIQVISDLLSGSRTSRLTGRLVLQEQLLRGVRCIPAYPGDKYEGICLVAGIPQQGKQPEDAQDVILGELNRFVSEGPTAAELARVQKSTRTSVLASVLSNSSMASLLATYHGLTGSWRSLVSELELTAGLTPAQVRGVSERVLSPSTMFTGYVYALEKPN